LLLDELSEFVRPALEALRQPLEEGRVAIARAGRSEVYRARFILVAATDPCACGYAGQPDRCTCAPKEIARRRQRLSGPLLDRIDLLAWLGAPRETASAEAPLTSSARARERVLQARRRQATRLANEGVSLNAHMSPSLLRRFVTVDDDSIEMLRAAARTGLVSMRGQHRAMRVARTIADLAGSERVDARHLGAALALRPEAVLPAGGGR
jgi:magnesium chelatase family protein